MDYFVYNGIDSRDLGVYIGEFSKPSHTVHLAPPSNSTTEKVSGWHGSLFVEQVYSDREISFDIYLTENNDNMLKKISAWLKVLGVHELYLSNEPYKVYNATFDGEFNIESYSDIFAKESLTFKCYDPFGYSSFTAQQIQNAEYNTGLQYNTGIVYVDAGIVQYSYVGADLPNIDIYHGGNTNLALPVITIVGSATNITIGRYSNSARTNLVEECEYGAFSGTLVINSSLGDTFLNGSINNATFDGDYFTLDGSDDIYFEVAGVASSSTTTSVILDDNASSVNDTYNNMLLVLQNPYNEVVEYQTIIDYVGATKTATVSTLNNIIDSNWKYSIYELQSGQNYFKITGTALSITSVNFDFKFVYL